MRHHLRPVECLLDIDIVQIFEMGLLCIESTDGKAHCLYDLAHQGTEARLNGIVTLFWFSWQCFCRVSWVAEINFVDACEWIVRSSPFLKIECSAVDLFACIG